MELYKSKTHVAGIDISYEHTSIGIVDVRGNILAHDEIITLDYMNVNEYVNALAEHLLMLAEKTCGIDRLRSVGISAPSGNYKTGCIENSPNFPWKGVIPLGTMLRERIGVAVALGNDAFAIAQGEMTYGSAHGIHNFALVTIGHGLGSCIFVDGKPIVGHLGFAGELGHTCINSCENARQCTCGLKGCLEAYVSARGIMQTAREVLDESDKPSALRDLDLSKATPKDVSQIANDGDELALEVYRRTGYVLGIALANLATLIDVKIIILTGGIVKAGKCLIEPTYASFEEHIFGNIRGRVRLLCSSLSDRERNILGASSLAWNVEEYSLFR